MFLKPNSVSKASKNMYFSEEKSMITDNSQNNKNKNDVYGMWLPYHM